MIEFLSALHTFEQDSAARTVLRWISEKLSHVDGVCYYKHPVIKINTGVFAELTLLLTKFNPVAIRCLPFRLEEIAQATKEEWQVNDSQIEAPLLELEDFAFKLQSLFGEDRYLRDILRPRAVLALPLISAQDFRGKFGDILTDALVIWSDGDVSTVLHSLEVELTEDYWRRARAIMQGVTPLTKPSSNTSLRADRLSDAIRLLDREIALLDDEQEKAALQIAPGPQQIRGLAGTGKTVLLAMKVANIHLHFPDRKVLFTFHTRSLYNQARSLITHFYRVHSKEDPDWSQVHIRHSWGGDTRPGVYSDLSARQGVKPMTLDEARQLNYSDPFRACCIDALKRPIVPVYDYVLVDEAQDMPNEFFQLLYRLTTEPHPITWAYDELQSLIALDIPTPEERFGVDDSGNPLVVLDDQDYPSGIEKDLVLP